MVVYIVKAPDGLMLSTTSYNERDAWACLGAEPQDVPNWVESGYSIGKYQLSERVSKPRPKKEVIPADPKMSWRNRSRSWYRRPQNAK